MIDTSARRRPLLHLVVGEAPPARDVPDFVPAVRASGWDVWVIATPRSRRCFDADRVRAATAHPVFSHHPAPGEEGSVPAAHAALLAPATFDIIGRLTAGLADTLALEALAQDIGAHLPVVAVPWVTRALASHPTYAQNLATLSSWGVTFIHPAETGTNPTEFPWREALRAVNALDPGG